MEPTGKDVSNAKKNEREEKSGAIKRKVRKIYKAIEVMKDLGDKKYVETIKNLEGDVAILEKQAIELLKQEFADLK